MSGSIKNVEKRRMALSLRQCKYWPSDLYHLCMRRMGLETERLFLSSVESSARRIPWRTVCTPWMKVEVLGG